MTVTDSAVALTCGNGETKRANPKEEDDEEYPRCCGCLYPSLLDATGKARGKKLLVRMLKSS